MGQNTTTDTPDSMIENFIQVQARVRAQEDKRERAGKALPETLPVTLWIPSEYKERFSELQRQTKTAFGDLCKEALKYMIDRVAAEIDQKQNS